MILSSCKYPDIDTIPDFKDVNLTMKESIELCKISYSNNNQNENLVTDNHLRKIWFIRPDMYESRILGECFGELNQITNRL